MFVSDVIQDYHFADGTHFGILAQELETVFPEMVNTDNTEYKSVNYSEMVPVLQEAVKAQQKTIEGMKAENILREQNEQSPAYGEKQFNELANRLSVTQNII